MDDNSNAKKVLLVEDDDNLATVYQGRLEAEGFRVRRVPDGEHALEAALDFKPDLILLDILLPNLGGFDVLDILRNTPETANTKIIMLTARSQQADKNKAGNLGADDYMVKSQVLLSDIVDKVEKYTEQGNSSQPTQPTSSNNNSSLSDGSNSPPAASASN